MYRLVFFGLLITACSGGASPVSSTPADDSARCDVEARGWMACDGQRIQVHGKSADFVYAHPIVGEGQTYMEVGEMQIIVIPGAAAACEGAMTVEGLLERIDMGGAPGTRDSYAGWAIHASAITCD
jgi:hypothetical protein